MNNAKHWIKEFALLLFQFNLEMLKSFLLLFWHCGVVVITALQMHLTQPELRFCAGSTPACSVFEIRNGEDL